MRSTVTAANSRSSSFDGIQNDARDMQRNQKAKHSAGNAERAQKLNASVQRKLRLLELDYGE